MDLNDLLEIKEHELAARKQFTLRCCMAAGCMSSNSDAVKGQLEKAVASLGLADLVEVRRVGCLKLCCQGPLVQVDPRGDLYQRVTPENAASIVETLKDGKTDVSKAAPADPFFTKQLSVVLANSG